MNNNTTIKNTPIKIVHPHWEEMVLLLVKTIIPLTLLIGGLHLLTINIPGWSLIFGLPMIVFGVVFSLYTYDEISSRKVDEEKDY